MTSFHLWFSIPMRSDRPGNTCVREIQYKNSIIMHLTSNPATWDSCPVLDQKNCRSVHPQSRFLSLLHSLTASTIGMQTPCPFVASGRGIHQLS